MRRTRHGWIGVLIVTLIGVMMLAPGGSSGQGQTALAKANSEANPDVHIEVTELKRTSGGTVTLKAMIVNESDKTFNPSATHSIYLLNTTNKLKHTVATDGKGGWLCSRSRGVKAKGRSELWAKFAAPPEDVTVLTVVVPKFAPLEDVALSN
jgi:hypothetical protein